MAGSLTTLVLNRDLSTPAIESSRFFLGGRVSACLGSQTRSWEVAMVINSAVPERHVAMTFKSSVADQANHLVAAMSVMAENGCS